MPDALSSASRDVGIAFTLLIVFVSAKLLALLFERMRMPGIVGEILAGILIGPHALHWVAPNEATVLLGELGVMFLLFRVGLEVKASELLAVGGRAAGIALAGVVLPFVAGWAISTAWGLTPVESIFIGAAMVATSVGITAHVLTTGGWIAQRSSQLILASAVIDDVLGLLILAVVSSLARGRIDWEQLATTAIVAGGFTVLVAAFGARVMGKVMPRVRSSIRLAEAEFSVAVALMFALSLLAVWAGVAAIIGAFLAGMAVSETVEKRVHHLTEGVTELLVPFFLVGIGLNFDVSLFRNTPAVTFALLILIAAALTKFVGCGLAALPLGRNQAMRVGVGMIPRGEVGMVVAQLGLALGAIEQTVYGTVVFMSIGTTLIAPPLLRLAFRQATVQKNGERADLTL